jgi:hypothetical protein
MSRPIPDIDAARSEAFGTGCPYHDMRAAAEGGMHNEENLSTEPPGA